jgi:cytochrome b subunit of formate dehydrogenase
MGGIAAPLSYLLVAFGITTAVLMVLVIYGHTLSTREEDQLYLNKAEQTMMASEQLVIIGKMDRLKKVIIVLAVASSVLMLASAGVWVWIGLTR